MTTATVETTSFLPIKEAETIPSFICITTTYKTDSQGRGKIKAEHKRGHDCTYRKTVDYQSALSSVENHYVAAIELIKTWPIELRKEEYWDIASRGSCNDHEYFMVRCTAR